MCSSEEHLELWFQPELLLKPMKLHLASSKKYKASPKISLGYLTHEIPELELRIHSLGKIEKESKYQIHLLESTSSKFSKSLIPLKCPQRKKWTWIMRISSSQEKFSRSILLKLPKFGYSIRNVRIRSFRRWKKSSVADASKSESVLQKKSFFSNLRKRLE